MSHATLDDALKVLPKGTFNHSAMGTLVEYSNRLVLLAGLKKASAPAARRVQSWLDGVPEAMRKTLPYDQGKAMRMHQWLTEVTGLAGFFADPHCAWPRGSNANPNGRLREHRPEGTDRSGHSQDDLNVMAWKRNNRPRKTHGCRTPLQVYNDRLQGDPEARHSAPLTRVELGL